jgi:ABC-type polysaccharide/polyol phosphate export permease
MYWLQLPYYTICLFVFIAGIGWLTSSINVFFKDVRQVVTILLQFGFWGTPIFWKIDTIPSQYHIILELNPLFYIIEGYRNIFINQIWFWEQPLSALYFSSIALAFLLFGTLVFKRLKPHFADVL